MCCFGCRICFIFIKYEKISTIRKSRIDNETKQSIYYRKLEMTNKRLTNEIKKGIDDLSDPCICHQRMW